jgi:uncharacterized protein YecT (DUF1311 family)
MRPGNFAPRVFSEIANMRAFLAAALIAVMGTTALSADTKKEEPAPVETAQGMVEALDKKIAAADADLNDAYKRLLARLDDTGKEKLKKAEHAWIAFRDAQCEVEADEARGGTLERVLRLKCCLRMIQARTAEIKGVQPLGQ